MTERQKEFALKRLNDDVTEVIEIIKNDIDNTRLPYLRMMVIGKIAMANYVGLITDSERNDYENRIDY